MPNKRIKRNGKQGMLLHKCALSELEQKVKPLITNANTAKGMWDILKRDIGRASEQLKHQLYTQFYNFKLVLEEEHKSTNQRSENQGNVAFYTQKNSNNRECYKCGSKDHIIKNCPKKGKWCKRCQKDNHNTQECFAKSKKQNQNYQDKKKSQKSCTYCKRTNHSSEDCYFKHLHQNKQDYKNQDGKVAFLSEAFQGHTANEKGNIKFIVDSGCNNHMTNDAGILTDTMSCDNVPINSAKKGASMISYMTGHLETKVVDLKNVSFVPDLSRNLMSVNKITENNGEVHFKKNEVLIYKEDKVVLKGEKNTNGLYVVDLLNQDGLQALNAQKVDVMMWHKRLGHMSLSQMKKLPSLCDGVPELLKKCEDLKCSVCAEAKLVRKPSNTVRQRAIRPLQIIHSDICGPISPHIQRTRMFPMELLDIAFLCFTGL
ncbi:hypothetical protein ONE63_011433 [Megalurothrips usitatus]|uniref:CCHC-type domain-containing protein n=1 Tax=Megalurothrips usitatus TaxID=439358 RepID=A0AAV7WZD6_9NEOP|nr:hypothetical protein ONE63_011433 [Megalurothrips usitatus]